MAEYNDKFIDGLDVDNDVKEKLHAVYEDVSTNEEARKLMEENPGALMQKHGINTKELPKEVLTSIAGGLGIKFGGGIGFGF